MANYLLVVVLSMLGTPVIARLARETLIRDDGDADTAERLILRVRDSHHGGIDSEDAE